MFKTSDPQKFLEEIKQEEFVKIYVQSDITSLCALKLLSSLLSKDYIKHEVIFIEDKKDIELDKSRFIYFYHGGHEENKENEQNEKRQKRHMNYINFKLHNKLLDSENRIEFVKEECNCDENNFNCLLNMFILCKLFNFLNEDALWCCIVPFSFYKNHLFLVYGDGNAIRKNQEDEDSMYESSDETLYTEETCNACNSIFTHINFEIKKSENNKQDGIMITKNLLHPLLLFSDIFSSLKHDIHFVIKHKLLYKKRRDIEEMKIKTFLAHKGVSIKFAKESYTNLDHSTKKFLLRNFQTGQQYSIIRRKTTVISAVDMAYIINCYLFNYRTTEAYLMLNKFSTIKLHIKKEVDLLFEVIALVKQSIITPIKFKNITIYKMKTVSTIKNIDCYIRFIYDLIGIYMRNRHSTLKYVVVVDIKEKDYFITAGRNVNISNLKINGISAIDKKTFYKNVVSEE